MTPIDILIVGGGLAGGVTATALKRLCPQTRIMLIEQEDHFGGNHRWSYFDSDLTQAGHRLLGGITKAHWPANEVRFPARSRVFQTAYNSIASRDYDIWLRTELAEHEYRTSCTVTSMDASGAELNTGETIKAGLVLDARGPENSPGLEIGWQKFAGFDFLLPDHGVTRPIIMDACVDQSEGYRFVYVLPLDQDRLFVEDTYYTLGAELDVAKLRDRALAYVTGLGAGAQEMGSETGILPIVINGDPQLFWPSNTEIARIGMAGGFFHHTTGYSLPFATTNALDFAEDVRAGHSPGADWWRQRFLNSWSRQGYFRLLNRMLFHAAKPDERYRVFEHFYRLPQGVIERFYSARLRGADKLRILSGKPPVGISSAIAALAGRKGQ